ncbi:unnamed protein product [marine sediment metagenome]|uniref:Uncharacterized protein n=1 Tax=marine sediment metagenome TaxID=412755 RepID=X1UQ57_9ZZZZ
MKNMDAAEVALGEMGKSVLVLEADRIEERDFAGGEVTKRFIALKNKGAVVVKNQAEVLKFVATFS